MKGRLFVLPGTRYGFTVADSPPQPPATSVSTEMMTEVLDSVKMKKEEGMEREWGWLRFVFTENLGGKTEKLLQLSSLAICNPGSSERFFFFFFFLCFEYLFVFIFIFVFCCFVVVFLVLWY